MLLLLVVNSAFPSPVNSKLPPFSSKAKNRRSSRTATVAPHRTARRMSDAAEDPFHEQGAATSSPPKLVEPASVESEHEGLLPTSSTSSSLSSSLNRDAASRASASTGASAADPSSALMSTPSAATHDDDGRQQEPQQPATAAYPFSADPYPQDEEAIKRHQARSAEREAEYQARQQQQDAVTSPPLPQLPADQDAAPDGPASKPRAQQQQRVYQRPARDAIQVSRGTTGHPSFADHRILLQIVDALKTSEGASAPYIVYCIRFEVSLPGAGPRAAGSLH